MSYWNWKQNKIIRFPPAPYPGYPGWIRLDCGCSGGLEWGGEYPRECRNCWGSGMIAKHEKSGVLAYYPGGPFLGRDCTWTELTC